MLLGDQSERTKSLNACDDDKKNQQSQAILSMHYLHGVIITALAWLY